MPIAAAVRQNRHQHRAPGNTERLLTHLHRGGVYAHLWTDAGRRSYWFRVDRRGRRRRVPRRWLALNVYFTIHPLSEIPPESGSGRRDRRYISSQLPYIAAINCLFADFDGKDYVEPVEYGPYLPADYAQLPQMVRRQAAQSAQEHAFYHDPAPYKQRALNAIERLDITPSVIVDSGGGYHCYWLLDKPVPLDDANRDDVQATQHAWVEMVQADPGASDLRRMLRLPGTYNHKPGFGPRPPRVTLVTADFDRVYAYTELEETVDDWLFRRRPAVPARYISLRYRNDEAESLRTAFNRRHSLVELLMQHGYRLSLRTAKLARLARPGRRRYESSVTVFPARLDGTPELSVHFSTNDPLYSEEHRDAETGRMRRRVHDAFAVYTMLEHDGDWRAAYATIRAAIDWSADVAE
ncbi:MAG: hypothetical protein H3C34_23495 [Caldilineaceae bacterium]|nr:hypothetical protein [Caldilineaceae bacterium]